MSNTSIVNDSKSDDIIINNDSQSIIDNNVDSDSDSEVSTQKNDLKKNERTNIKHIKNISNLDLNNISNMKTIQKNTNNSNNNNNISNTKNQSNTKDLLTTKSNTNKINNSSSRKKKNYCTKNKIISNLNFAKNKFYICNSNSNIKKNKNTLNNNSNNSKMTNCNSNINNTNNQNSRKDDDLDFSYRNNYYKDNIMINDKNNNNSNNNSNNNPKSVWTKVTEKLYLNSLKKAYKNNNNKELIPFDYNSFIDNTYLNDFKEKYNPENEKKIERFIQRSTSKSNYIKLLNIDNDVIRKNSQKIKGTIILFDEKINKSLLSNEDKCKKFNLSPYLSPKSNIDLLKRESNNNNTSSPRSVRQFLQDQKKFEEIKKEKIDNLIKNKIEKIKCKCSDKPLINSKSIILANKKRKSDNNLKMDLFTRLHNEKSYKDNNNNKILLYQNKKFINNVKKNINAIDESFYLRLGKDNNKFKDKSKCHSNKNMIKSKSNKLKDYSNFMSNNNNNKSKILTNENMKNNNNNNNNKNQRIANKFNLNNYQFNKYLNCSSFNVTNNSSNKQTQKKIINNTNSKDMNESKMRNFSSNFNTLNIENDKIILDRLLYIYENCLFNYFNKSFNDDIYFTLENLYDIFDGIGFTKKNYNKEKKIKKENNNNINNNNKYNKEICLIKQVFELLSERNSNNKKLVNSNILIIFCLIILGIIKYFDTSIDVNNIDNKNVKNYNYNYNKYSNITLPSYIYKKLSILNNLDASISKIYHILQQNKLSIRQINTLYNLFSRNYYDNLLISKNKKEKIINKLNEENKHIYTFKPEINNNSEKLLANLPIQRKNQDGKDLNLYDIYAIKILNFKKSINNLKAIQEKNKLNECSFKPNLSLTDKINKSITPDKFNNLTVTERLYLSAIRKKNKQKLNEKNSIKKKYATENISIDESKNNKIIKSKLNYFMFDNNPLENDIDVNRKIEIYKNKREEDNITKKYLEFGWTNKNIDKDIKKSILAKEKNGSFKFDNENISYKDLLDKFRASSSFSLSKGNKINITSDNSFDIDLEMNNEIKTLNIHQGNDILKKIDAFCIKNNINHENKELIVQAVILDLKKKKRKDNY